MTQTAEVLLEELGPWADRLTLEKAAADLKRRAQEMSPDEARFFVDAYYQMQEHRKALANQRRSSEVDLVLLDWLCGNVAAMENQCKAMLEAYADADPVGRWTMGLYGVGPCISAGLLAHIDIAKAKTAGSIWRYAGLDPTVTWEKKQKRPWNADLKVLAWKFADVQWKFKGSDQCFYGPLMAEYKAALEERNEAGAFADAAAAVLEKKPDHKQKAIYAQGKLPPGHIHARALRWGAKLFLSHWHTVAYRLKLREEPPKPYVIEHLGHVGMIDVPNWPIAEDKAAG